MSEQALWHFLREQMRDEDGHWHRVENLLDRGTPDVDWACWGTEGWLELKEIPEWPKRESSIVRIDHYTDDQRRWIMERGDAHGNVKLLLRVARPRMYLLFDYQTAAMRVGKVTRAELIEHAIVASGPAFPFEEMRHGLMRKW